MTEPAQAPSGEALPDMSVEAVLERFGGDARAALAAALADIAGLEDRLAIAEMSASYGYFRGGRSVANGSR